MLICRVLIFFIMIFPGNHVLGQSEDVSSNSLYTNRLQTECVAALKQGCTPKLKAGTTYDEAKTNEEYKKFCAAEANKLDGMLNEQAKCEDEANKAMAKLHNPEKEKEYLDNNPLYRPEIKATINLLNGIRAITPSLSAEAEDIRDRQKKCFEENVLPFLPFAQAQVNQFDSIEKARLACTDIMAWPNQNRAALKEQFGQEEANKIIGGMRNRKLIV